jgi:hypothetical protein
VSLLLQAPEAAGVAEYVVLAEAVAQDGIAPTRPKDPHSTVPSAMEAQPVSVAIRAHTLATAVSATSSDSTQAPVQWGVGIPLRSSSNRGSSSRATTSTPEAHAGGPTTLDEFVNGPEFGVGDYMEDIDLEAGRNHHAKLDA